MPFNEGRRLPARDKSAIIADRLAQIGHWLGFRLIVEDALSHGVLTQTQGCELSIVNAIWVVNQLGALRPLLAEMRQSVA